jgi:hypothetical protein
MTSWSTWRQACPSTSRGALPELSSDHVRLALASRHEASTSVAEGSVVDLVHIWRDVAGRMEAHLVAGRRHLLTEDVLRWATIDALIEAGVVPDDLQVEVIIPTTRGKIDLVVGRNEEATAVEFKFPRDSRTGISPDTMTLGELLKDVYRLAAVPSFGERWAVMFLNDRLRRYLERRTDCGWTFERGEELAFSPEAFALLPQTASRGLGEWAEASAVAVCRVSGVVSGHPLVAYEVQGQR